MHRRKRLSLPHLRWAGSPWRIEEKTLPFSFGQVPGRSRPADKRHKQTAQDARGLVVAEALQTYLSRQYGSHKGIHAMLPLTYNPTAEFATR